MSVNINNVEEFLISELKLTKEESKTFLFIVKNGRKDVTKIAESLELSENEASNVANSLVEKGMIINISQSEYESLILDLLFPTVIEDVAEKIIFRSKKTC